MFLKPDAVSFICSGVTVRETAILLSPFNITHAGNGREVHLSRVSIF
jgi:hypothetical protein